MKLKNTNIIESYTKDELLILKGYLKFCIANFSNHYSGDKFVGFCYGVDKYVESRKINFNEKNNLYFVLNKFVDDYIYENRTKEFSFCFHSAYERKELAKKTINIINKKLRLKLQ